MINYQWIDDYVNGLIELFETNNVHDLYDCLDIKVIKLPEHNILLNENQALYYRNYCGDEVVFIADNLNLKYEEFIMAHELAHAIIHTEVSTAAFNKNLINTGKLEKQANYFAFKLLGISFDRIELDNFSIEQISSSLELPLNVLKQLVVV